MTDARFQDSLFREPPSFRKACDVENTVSGLEIVKSGIGHRKSKI
jgi:hypothetical protein